MKENFADIVKANTAESELLDAIDPERVPAHVAIIMDGNGRWAKRQGKPRIYGHRAGSESVKAIIDTCARLEVKAVTLYAFSTENWKRPRSEVSGLMSMLKRVLRRELDQVHNNNIRFQTIGDIDGLSPDVQRELAAATEKTRNNNGLIMNVALNYGGRAEITRAAQLAMVQLLKEGREISSLTEADIDRHLFTNGLPEIDLLIRTSGEFRIVADRI